MPQYEGKTFVFELKRLRKAKTQQFPLLDPL
jgi:hypothetical protein